MEELIVKIHSVLTEDLLRPKYRRESYPHITTGHCYLAAEVLYHLWGKKHGFQPMCCSLGAGRTHWYLQDKDGRIADPTKEQYYAQGLDPPYHLGKGKGFCTLKPSKRAVIVFSRLGLFPD